MMISVAIEKPALAYQLVVMSMHDPGIALFQARATGVHWNTEAKKAPTIYEVMITKST